MNFGALSLIALSFGRFAAPDAVLAISPPEDGFFTKLLPNRGLAIKASGVVSDAALFEAQRRIEMELAHLHVARANLVALGAELQIIGKDQVTSDLPDYRGLKGRPFDGSLTVDQRTRGLGGRHTSCGEENLLKLDDDRYKGRDICVHEFAHCLMDYGFDDALRARIEAQYRASLAKGLWKGAYAATNPDEFFAELTMWYFGTHGDLHMTGTIPEDGREGLRKYDPDAAAFLDKVYRGEFQVSKMSWERLLPSGSRQKPDRHHSNFWRTVVRFDNGLNEPVDLWTVGKDGHKVKMGVVPAKSRYFAEPESEETFAASCQAGERVYALRAGALRVDLASDFTGNGR